MNEVKRLIRMVVPVETEQGTALFFYPASHCKYYMHNYKLLTKIATLAKLDSKKKVGCGHWVYTTLIDVEKPLIGFEREQIWA